ncbi:MAG: glycine cleavage system aminomethyltransferase GcvT [Bacteroidetes bacterium]|nr:MAG: glycine cleavage system protein T [Bacteroidota bacterium]PTM10798.1 MAG: glycine cleavage system aminomethyltransferase GcvT [Bacteroidota bacterium]
MKSTPLRSRHEELGAKMAEFAGFYMPISYSGIKEEHQAVRTRAGIFDVSHMGEFIVRGREALDFIQHVTSNDASKLAIGQAQYSCFPNAEGGIVDDLLVYRLAEDNCSAGERAYMLVVNGANLDKDWRWLFEHNTFDTRLLNISDQTGLIAVQGPAAAAILQPLTSVDLSAISYYTFTKGQVAGVDNVIISATGYTGSGGFELYADAEHIGLLWDAVMAAGKDHGLLPAGLGARDTLRLEMGYCLYGNDLTDSTNPLEAGLGWITKLGKGDFVGKAPIVAQKTAELQRRLVGFTLAERRVPRHGYPIENAAGEVIGEVTSGTQSPSLDLPIGMGYVPAEMREPGTEIFVVAGKKRLAATVCKIPFLSL